MSRLFSADSDSWKPSLLQGSWWQQEMTGLMLQYLVLDITLIRWWVAANCKQASLSNSYNPRWDHFWGTQGAVVSYYGNGLGFHLIWEVDYFLNAVTQKWGSPLITHKSLGIKSSLYLACIYLSIINKNHCLSLSHSFTQIYYNLELYHDGNHLMVPC